MVTKTIGVGSEKVTLHDLLSLVRDGVKIILMEGSKPVAHLLPARSPGAPRIPGLNEGAVTWISDDFDEPLDIRSSGGSGNR
jgi:antitoxin (DNA-binding transcriptional repressor) of toxin-antitoxin stability system